MKDPAGLLDFLSGLFLFLLKKKGV